MRELQQLSDMRMGRFVKRENEFKLKSINPVCTVQEFLENQGAEEADLELRNQVSLPQMDRRKSMARRVRTIKWSDTLDLNDSQTAFDLL